MDVGIHSEVGRLRTVLVHHPGYEHRKIFPWNNDAMLFDDVLDVEEAVPQHDEFVSLLRNHGVEVLHFSELLADVMSSAREDVIREVLAPEKAEYFLSNALCTKHLIWGYPEYLTPERKQVLPPLPNLYFTRDPAFVVHDKIVISNPAKPARRPEARLVKAVLSRHPLFADCDIYDGLLGTKATVEGGDIHVVNDESVVIGVGERTNEAGMEALRDYLFENTAVNKVFAVYIPAKREFMHLDTVMTFVDRRRLLTLPYVWENPSLYGDIASIAKGQCEMMGEEYIGPNPDYFEESSRLEVHKQSSGSVIIERYEDTIAGLAEYEVVDPALTIHVAGSTHRFSNAHEHIAEALREQWNDGANCLTVKPGWVMAYRRNDRTQRSLTYAGIRCIEFRGGELVRGRGGARCMSMPLVRDRLMR